MPPQADCHISIEKLDAIAAAAAGSDDAPTGAGRRAIRVTFQDLNYVVTNSANRKAKLSLLTGVSGALLPGELSALLGPSGSGKTTLLDVLAGRKTVGQVQGSILFGGRPPSQTFLRRYTGYVEQFDTLLSNLTPCEMLSYTAAMKNPRSESQAAQQARVETIITQLMLTSCRDVIIGNVLERGISGGQAKRVNIGLALVTNPRILFLDECTSGLDSYSANEVMSVVKSLVPTGITVCTTIHSPTPYAFALLDRITILLRGRVVYWGLNGDHSLRYFQQACPDAVPMGSTHSMQSASEWIVDLTTKADRDGRALEFASLYEKSSQRQENEALLAAQLADSGPVSATTLAELGVKRATATPFWFGILQLLKHRGLKDLRDPAWLLPRIMDKLIVALLIMTLYWGIGDDLSSVNANNISAVLFMWAILPGFSASSYVPAIVLERGLFVRERSDGLYRTITYLCFKLAEEVFLALLISLPFSCLVFFPLQMQGSWALFWAVYFLTTIIGIALAYFIAALAPNMDAANAAVPAYVVTLLFFVGMLIRQDDMPSYWGWYLYIDFLHFAWGALVINQYEGKGTTVYGGREVLEFYNLDGRSRWALLGYESLFFIAFFTLAWLALAFKRHQKR
ncbi:hypothetical protein WJX72_000974 [[Myrmecia] bisecta]|uniref:ABC transporter domain-containing protein n=1 Tax=[Myrmecia] bisecta TaxID=41462 RepID=A0AAW1P4K4_9CHLO